MRRVAPLAVALLVGACAPGLPPAAPGTTPAAAGLTLAARLAHADGLVRDGCYECLTEAREVYTEAAGGANRPQVLPRLFEVNLLLAVRDKELALDARGPVGRAQALVAELPASIDAPVMLAIVEAIAPDPLGTPSSVEDALAKAHPADRARLASWRETLSAATLSAPVRAYLRLALDCAHPDAEARFPQPTSADPPLVRYRAAICPIASAPLAGVWREVPRFTEIAFYLGRAEIGGIEQHGPTRALALLAQARAKFPDSPSMAYVDGAVHQTIEEYTQAVADYDQVIALAPAHALARLGRVESLTMLGRTDEAIAGASALIDMNEHVADAYYWRARNQRAAGRLTQARADIDTAKELSRSTDVLTLAGIIEYEQTDLQGAEGDLELARSLADGNCTAAWYLGLVEQARVETGAAAQSFGDAAVCYGVAAEGDERKRAAVAAAADMDSRFKAAQTARFAAAVSTDRSQESASNYNAAASYVRLGNAVKATEFADRAARDPARADLVAKLRELIKKIGSGTTGTTGPRNLLTPVIFFSHPGL